MGHKTNGHVVIIMHSFCFAEKSSAKLQVSVIKELIMQCAD